jgi:hypothetical protein
MGIANEQSSPPSLLGQALLDAIRQAVKEAMQEAKRERTDRRATHPEDLADRFKVPLFG